MSFAPAYGKDYKSRAEVLAAWNADKDFADTSLFNTSGTYTNRPDAEREGLRSITIRYKRLTMQTILMRGKDGTWK